MPIEYNKDVSYPILSTQEDLLLHAPKPNERVLYFGSGSPQAWLVLLILEEHQLPFRAICISFSSKILKSSYFQALNPRMRVPILLEPVEDSYDIIEDLERDVPRKRQRVQEMNQETTNIMENDEVEQDRTILYESAAILAYLEKKYPQYFTFWPRNFCLYGIAQARYHETNELLSVVGDLVGYLRKFPRQMQSRVELTYKWAALKQELRLWEDYLGDKTYLIPGEEPYVCDFALFTILAYAVRCGLELHEECPRLDRFYSILKARESIVKTWPPHWKATTGSKVLLKCCTCDKLICVCKLEPFMPAMHMPEHKIQPKQQPSSPPSNI